MVCRRPARSRCTQLTFWPLPVLFICSLFVIRPWSVWACVPSTPRCCLCVHVLRSHVLVPLLLLMGFRLLFGCPSPLWCYAPSTGRQPFKVVSLRFSFAFISPFGSVQGGFPKNFLGFSIPFVGFFSGLVDLGSNSI